MSSRSLNGDIIKQLARCHLGTAVRLNLCAILHLKLSKTSAGTLTGFWEKWKDFTGNKLKKKKTLHRAFWEIWSPTFMCSDTLLILFNRFNLSFLPRPSLQTFRWGLMQNTHTDTRSRWRWLSFRTVLFMIRGTTHCSISSWWPHYRQEDGD